MSLFFYNSLLSLLLIVENILNKSAKSKINPIRELIYLKFLKLNLDKVQIAPIKTIEIEFLTDNFLKNLSQNEPIIFKGLAKNTTAAKKWSLDYLSDNYGKLSMPFWNSSHRVSNQEVFMTLEEGIADIKERKNNFVLYGGAKDIINQKPELAQDVELLNISDKNFWATKKNTIYKIFITCKDNSSPPHSELGHILNFQFVGKKKWLIFPPCETNKLFPAATNTVYLGSQKFKIGRQIKESKINLKGWESDLEEGDILYIPPFFWHSVESIDDSISVAFKWAEAQIIFKNPIISTYMFTCRNPNILQLFFINFFKKKFK